MSAPTIVAVGMFDGVHTGHRYLLRHLRQLAAERGLQAAVVTFTNHPAEILAPAAVPKLITDTATKLSLLRAQGIDRILTLPFDDDLRRLTARQFAENILLPQLDARALLLGYDNGFGSDLLRRPDDYRNSLAGLSIDIFDYTPLPESHVSSSAVRLAIAEGRITEAVALLGHPFSLKGTVVHGKQLGRTIGFPTANLAVAPQLIIPAPGVYAACVASDTPDIARLPAMLNIGTAPTVNGTASEAITVEAHIITDRPLDLYGQTITLQIVARLRDEQHFDSLDALREALLRDRKETESLVRFGSSHT